MPSPLKERQLKLFLGAENKLVEVGKLPSLFLTLDLTGQGFREFFCRF